MVAKLKNAKRANGANTNGEEKPPVFGKMAQAAIAFAADAQIKAGKMQMAIFANHIRAYQNDKTYTDNAMAVLNAIRDRVVAHWVAHPGHFANPERSVPPVRAERMSEWRKIVRMGDWKCVETVIEYFKDDNMTFDDCKHVANYLIRSVPKNGKPPEKAALVDVIRAEKKKKTGRYDESGKAVKATTTTRALDVEKAATATARLAAGWKLYIGKEMKAQRAEALELVKTITDAAGQLVALKAAAMAEAE